jgi:hypothetical protein
LALLIPESENGTVRAFTMTVRLFMSDRLWHESMKTRLIWALVVLLGLTISPSRGLSAEPGRKPSENETKFETIQIGTNVYRNVTVRTVSDDYIFIVHSAGMTSLKVTNLPPELRLSLGFAPPEPPRSVTSNATVWAKETLAKIETPEIKQVEERIRGALFAGGDDGERSFPVIDPKILLIGGVGLVVFYLLVCWCLSLICQKAGQPGGVLVWIPVLQLFPMFRAAGMSGWWFVAAILPGLNIIAQIVWAVKIVKARGKGVWVTVMMLLPITNFFALLYLAFSSAPAAEPPVKRVEVMTLEAA